MTGNNKTGKKPGKAMMVSPRSGAEVPTGAHPQNTGGKPGRSGRKSIAFKTACGEIVNDTVLPKVKEYIETHNVEDPGFKWAAEQVLAYGLGKPTQSIKHGSDTKEPLTIVHRHE